jgi:hypothetical protein
MIIFIELIVAGFIYDVHQYQQANGYASSKTKNVYKRKNLVL